MYNISNFAVMAIARVHPHSGSSKQWELIIILSPYFPHWCKIKTTTGGIEPSTSVHTNFTFVSNICAVERCKGVEEPLVHIVRVIPVLRVQHSPGCLVPCLAAVAGAGAGAGHPAPADIICHHVPLHCATLAHIHTATLYPLLNNEPLQELANLKWNGEVESCVKVRSPQARVDWCMIWWQRRCRCPCPRCCRPSPGWCCCPGPPRPQPRPQPRPPPRPPSLRSAHPRISSGRSLKQTRLTITIV